MLQRRRHQLHKRVLTCLALMAAIATHFSNETLQGATYGVADFGALVGGSSSTIGGPSAKTRAGPTHPRAGSALRMVARETFGALIGCLDDAASSAWAALRAAMRAARARACALLVASSICNVSQTSPERPTSRVCSMLWYPFISSVKVIASLGESMVNGVTPGR